MPEDNKKQLSFVRVIWYIYLVIIGIITLILAGGFGFIPSLICFPFFVTLGTPFLGAIFIIGKIIKAVIALFSKKGSQ